MKAPVNTASTETMIIPFFNGFRIFPLNLFISYFQQATSPNGFSIYDVATEGGNVPKRRATACSVYAMLSDVFWLRSVGYSCYALYVLTALLRAPQTPEASLG